jgi:transposase-like protein
VRPLVLQIRRQLSPAQGDDGGTRRSGGSHDHLAGGFSATLHSWRRRSAGTRATPAAPGRVDETCIRVNGEWKWLFRAVDKHGRTVDFLLTHRRNAKAARRFLAKALRTRQDWPPHLINTDQNPAYGEALRQLKRDDPDVESIEHRQTKYLNNRIEADHGPSSDCAERHSGSSR